MPGHSLTCALFPFTVKDCTDSGLRKWTEAVIEKQKEKLASDNNSATAATKTYSNPKTVIPLFVPIYSFPFTIISWAKCGIGGKVSRPFVCDVTYNWTSVVAL